MDTNRFYDMLNVAVQPSKLSANKRTAISSVLNDFKETNNALETCKQGLYFYRPSQLTPTSDIDIDIPSGFKVADEDRSFTLEYLKDCCLLFNIEEKQCWNMYERYADTLPSKVSQIYDHVEVYKLKNTCIKMKDIATNKGLDYKTIVTFLKSFQNINSGSNNSNDGNMSSSMNSNGNSFSSMNDTYVTIHGNNHGTNGIMNGQSILAIVNVFEQIVRAAWDAAVKKILGQQATHEKLQTLGSRNAIHFAYQPNLVNKLSAENKADYKKIEAELYSGNYKLDQLKILYNALYGQEQTVEDFDTICQVGSTLYHYFNQEAFKYVMKFGEFYFSNRSSLIDIIIFAFNRYSSIVFEMVPSHPINAPIDRFVKALLDDWIGIRLLVQIAQYQYNNNSYFNNNSSNVSSNSLGSNVVFDPKKMMSDFIGRYEWLNEFVDETGLGMPPSMWGNGNVTPKNIFQHPFFNAQQDGYSSGQLRSKTFNSFWLNQIGVEENKLTEAFTLYLYITRAKTDENHFMEGFYEIIKAYIYLNSSSGSLNMINSPRLLNQNSSNRKIKYNGQNDSTHGVSELIDTYVSTPEKRTRLLNTLAIILCIQPERDDIYQTHKHILFSSDGAHNNQVNEMLQNSSSNINDTPQRQQSPKSEIFEFFDNISASTSLQKSHSGENDFLSLMWNSFIVSTIEDHFKDEETGNLINPFKDDDHRHTGYVETMLNIAQQTSQEKYKNGINWVHSMLYVMQNENTIADCRNKISCSIAQICLASGLESIIRAFPNILSKRDTVQQLLSILRLTINGAPQLSDQIFKTLNNNSMKKSYLAPIISSSEQYIKKRLNQRQSQMQQRSDGNNNTKSYGDAIFYEYIGVLAKLCKGDHFVEDNNNDGADLPRRSSLIVIDDDQKIGICNSLNNNIWQHMYHYLRKISFVNNVQTITKIQNVLNITNVLEFIGNAYPYSFSKLVKSRVGYSSGSSNDVLIDSSNVFNVEKVKTQKARSKQLEFDEGEILVSYILKIFYSVTSINTNDFVGKSNKDHYIDSIFKLYRAILLCIKNLFNMFPDVFVQSLERDDRFFIALGQLKTTCRAFCAYGALNDSFEYLKVCVNYLVRHTSIIDLERQFRHIDENNDRLISRQEFRDALKKPPYMLNLSSEALQKLLKRFDQDGDGNVDYGEFVQFVFDMETGSDGTNNTNNNVSNNGKSKMQNEYDEKEGDDVQVDREIRRVLQVLSGRTPTTLKAYQLILSKVVKFTCNILAENMEWAYKCQLNRFVILKNVFSIIKTILSENDEIFVQDKMSAREKLINAILRDRIIQKSLIGTVTYLSTSCMDSSSNVHKDVLPVDFTALNGGMNSLETAVERDLLERITEDGLNVVLSVLNFQPRLKNNFNDDIRISKLKITLLMQRVFTTRQNSNTKWNYAAAPLSNAGNDNKLFPKQSFNQLVAIASYASYHHRRNTCIPLLAIQILTTLARVVAISKEPAHLFNAREDQKNNLKKGKFNAGNSTNGDSLTFNKCHGSLIAFFDDEKYAFARSIVNCLSENRLRSEENGSSAIDIGNLANRNSADVQSEIISFLCVCVEKQPAMAALLLSEPKTIESLKCILNKVNAYREKQPKILSRVLALLSSLWHARSNGQFKGIVDSFRGVANGGANNNETNSNTRDFWMNVTSPLFIPLKDSNMSNVSANMIELSSNVVDYSMYEERENYCYQLDIRSFALQLFGLELYTGESAATMEEVKQKIISTPTGKENVLQMWFTSFCCFDFRQNVISALNAKALNLGVDLRAFQNKFTSKMAGRRTYGVSYIYDVEKIQDMLTKMRIKTPRYDSDTSDNISRSELTIVEGDLTDEKQFIYSVHECNMMCANSDAQLLLLKSCRRFIESYCLSGSLRTKRMHQSTQDSASMNEVQRRGTITVKRSTSLGNSVSSVPDTTSMFIGDATSFQMLGVLCKRLREIHQPEVAVSKAAYELSEMFLSMVFHQLYDDKFSLRPHTLDAAKSIELLSNINLLCKNVFLENNTDLSLRLPLLTSALLLFKNWRRCGDIVEDRKIGKSLLGHACSCIFHLSKVGIDSMSNFTNDNRQGHKNIELHRIGRFLTAQIVNDGSLNMKNEDELEEENKRALLFRVSCAIIDTVVCQYPQESLHDDDLYTKTDMKDIVGKIAEYNVFGYLTDVLWSTFCTTLVSNSSGMEFQRRVTSRALSILKVFRSLAHFEDAASHLCYHDIVGIFIKSPLFQSLNNQPRPAPGNVVNDIHNVRVEYENCVRGYAISQERSIIHMCWCLSVKIVLQLLRAQRSRRAELNNKYNNYHSGQNTANTYNNNSTTNGKENVLDIVTVFHYISKYETTICWAIEPFKYGERLTLASLEEMDCTMQLIYEIVREKATAQRWLYIAPAQFRGLTRGCVRNVQALSLLLSNKKKSASNVAGRRAYMRNNTLYVSEQEQHKYRGLRRAQLRIVGMRRDELSLICHGLESEIIQQLMQGSTRDEFKVVIWLLGDNSDMLESVGHSLKESHIDTLVKILDEDGDGSITLEEFKSTLDKFKNGQMGDQYKEFSNVFKKLADDSKKVEAIFAEFDVDEGGDIDKNEFKKGLERMRLQVINVRKGDPVDPIRCLQRGEFIQGKFNENEIVMKNIFDSGINSGSSCCMPIYESSGRIKGSVLGVLQVLCKNASYNPSEEDLLKFGQFTKRISEHLTLSAGDRVKYMVPRQKNVNDPSCRNRHVTNGRRNNLLHGPQDAEITYVYMSSFGYSYDVRLDDKFFEQVENQAARVLRSALLLISVQAITPWNIQIERGLIDTPGAISIFEYTAQVTTLELKADNVNYHYQPTIAHLFTIATYAMRELISSKYAPLLQYIDGGNSNNGNQSDFVRSRSNSPVSPRYSPRASFSSGGSTSISEKQSALTYADYKALIDERDLISVILEMALYLIWNNASRAQYLYKKYSSNIITQQQQDTKIGQNYNSNNNNTMQRKALTSEEKNAADMKKYYESAHFNLKRFEKNIFDLMYPKSSSGKKRIKWPLQKVTKSRVEDWILRIRSQLFPNKKSSKSVSRYNNMR
jgi:Ca2+-binding EF-hand superfamily protein